MARRRLPDRTCQQCGTAFRMRDARNANRFCSHACYWAGDFARRRRTLAARLAASIEKPDGEAGCWLWTGALFSTGYGQVSRGTGTTPTTAHRAMWIVTHGDISDGLWVLHRCDVRPCCNPAHLFLGDAAANTADMVAKGRGRGRYSRERPASPCP